MKLVLQAIFSVTDAFHKKYVWCLIFTATFFITQSLSYFSMDVTDAEDVFVQNASSIFQVPSYLKLCLFRVSALMFEKKCLSLGL